jgi:succinoglycan biosynthesis protein ExoA
VNSRITGDPPSPGAGVTAAALEPSEVIVVLPALNEAAHIEACLRSLMVPPDWMAGTRIVVVDGGSRDATCAIVRRLAREIPNLVLLDNPRRLQSAGINAVVATIAGPEHRVMVRCDVHAIYPPGFVRDAANAVRQRGVASVVTPMDAIGSSAVQRASAWAFASGGAVYRGGAQSGYVDHGHHAAFDLDWFRRIGGYDSSFSHNEDAEYDTRLARAGGRIWFEAGIRLAYVMRPTLGGLWRQYWSYGRGRARTIAKHRVRPRLRQIVPVAEVVLLALSALVGLAWPPALLWNVFYGALLLLASVVCAIQLRLAAGLLAGPALGVMHLGWGLGFLRQIGVELVARRGGPDS